jgi:hypothetical protein
MQLKHLLTALLVSSVVLPAAMAKSTGLHIKSVPVKMRAAGKSKKSEKAVSEKPAKRARKGAKRGKKNAPEI